MLSEVEELRPRLQKCLHGWDLDFFIARFIATPGFKDQGAHIRTMVPTGYHLCELVFDIRKPQASRGKRGRRLCLHLIGLTPKLGLTAEACPCGQEHGVADTMIRRRQDRDTRKTSNQENAR